MDADTGKPEPTNIRAVAISETGDEKSTPHQDELTPLLERLRSAIEASVYERLDPGAVLEVGELLVDLEAGERAIPEPDPSGELRFPILGTPEGLSAELRVARAQNYANVLVLKTSLTPPPEPYYLEGVLRAELSCRIQIWTDMNGELSDFSILTTVQPHYRESQRQGLPFETGTIIEGVLYHLKIGNPTEAQMTAIGLRDGVASNWPIPVVIDQMGWPELGRIERFSGKPLKMYDRIRQ